MNFAELADADAALVVEDDEDGCVISVDLAAGALVVEVDEGGWIDAPCACAARLLLPGSKALPITVRSAR